MGRNNREYALYDGETFITCGTIKQICQETGLKKEPCHFTSRKSTEIDLKIQMKE